MLLSESFKKRLQILSGIILEITDNERMGAFARSDERVPFNKDLMIQAIKEGREVGLLFQSKNEKYVMPVSKYRTIYPVAMGLSKKGNLVIRGFHKFGQSESEAIRTGKRSAEVENTWRLFKASNIKSMFFTGNFFRGPLEAYNSAGDAGMVNIEIQADFNEIIAFQEKYIQNMSDQQAQIEKRKNIVHLFKNTGERPLEQPYANPGEQNNKPTTDSNN